MSTTIKNTPDIQLLATYGTLRDDDNSGAAWTKDFVKVPILLYVFGHCKFSRIFLRVLVMLLVVDSLAIAFSVIRRSNILLQF